MCPCCKKVWDRAVKEGANPCEFDYCYCPCEFDCCCPCEFDGV